MGRVCLHGFVSGRVQGVYYRQSTEQQAERLGVDGWVRNLADGRVEVLLEGEEEAVRELKRWLHEGPANAEVSAVDVQEVPTQGITGFIVRR